MTLTRDQMNRYPSARGLGPDLEPEPEDQTIHYFTCKACGQAVDKRKVGDLFHHEEPGHDPIPLND
jgi:hypothetical protein